MTLPVAIVIASLVMGLSRIISARLLNQSINNAASSVTSGLMAISNKKGE